MILRIAPKGILALYPQLVREWKIIYEIRFCRRRTRRTKADFEIKKNLLAVARRCAMPVT